MELYINQINEKINKNKINSKNNRNDKKLVIGITIKTLKNFNSQIYCYRII